MSMQGNWYPLPPGPVYGPPIPPSMADPYGIQSLYQAPDQAISPGGSPLAGFNSPSAVDSLYASAEGASGGGGAIRNFLGGFGSGAAEEAPALLQAGALRTFAPTAAGFTAANIAHGVSPLKSNSAPEGFLEGMLAGAGVGGTVGMLGGPFDPITVPAGIIGGGVIGGVANALSNYFGGDDNKGPSFGKDDRLSREQDLVSLMQTAGMTDAQQSQVLKSFSVYYNIAPDDATRKQAFETMQQGIASQVAQQASAPPALTPEQILATQALATSVMKPYADQIQAQGAAGQSIYNNLADSAPSPAIAALARSMGEHSLEGATKLAAAYQSQALILPSLNALQLANQYGQAAYPKVGAYPAASTTTPNIQALYPGLNPAGSGS